jgi:hypothetical protein
MAKFNNIKKSFLLETNGMIEAMKEIILENPDSLYLEIFLEGTGKRLFYDVIRGDLKDFCVPLAGSNPMFRSIPLPYFRMMTETDYWVIVRNLEHVRSRCLKDKRHIEKIMMTWKDPKGKTFENGFHLTYTQFRLSNIGDLIRNHTRCLFSSKDPYKFVGISVSGNDSYELF